MKTPFRYAIVLTTLFIASQSSNLLAQDTAAPQSMTTGRVAAIHASLSAEVSAIDLDKREVTLKGPQGNEVTVTAGDAVKRLDEVKVGDFVRVDYLVAIAAELRPPTAEEAEHPLVIMAAGGRASDDSAPVGGIARKFKVVTTIEALNLPDQTVTVKGPLGHYLTARVADPANLTKFHLGDTIVITYTEALAVSLDKVEKKSGE